MSGLWNFTKRWWVVWAAIVVIVIAAGVYFTGVISEAMAVSKYLKTPVSFDRQEVIPSGDIEQTIDSGRIKGALFISKSILVLASQKVYVKLDDGRVVWAYIIGEKKSSYISRVEKVGVKPSGDIPVFPGEFAAIQIGPFLLFIIVIIWGYTVGVRGGAFKDLMKGKTKRVISNVGFADVAGLDEEKEQFQEAIMFLQYPDNWRDFGEVGVGAIIEHGPPGCGKTHMARAVAGEAKVPFFAISAANVEGILVGKGTYVIDEFFDLLEKNAPCVGFVDEFEALGRHRGGGFGDAASRSYDQTTAQTLHRIDGIFEKKKPILLIAATNRLDLIDEAILRAGRFGAQILIGLPDLRGREEILKVHTRNRPLAPDVDLAKIAKLTPHFSGAFLAELVKEAARQAVKSYIQQKILHPLAETPRLICQKDFEKARNKVLHGVAKKINLSGKEKEVAGAHETGHGVVARVLPSIPPLTGMSIIPHEKSLGRVEAPEGEDKHLEFVSEVKEDITVLLAGREAEKLCYKKDFTLGARNDLERATKLAKHLVYEGGVLDEDPELGPQYFGDPVARFGSPSASHMSDITKAKLDRKVGEIINACAQKASEILSRDDVRPVFEELKNTLLKEEELGAEEVEVILSKIPSLPEKQSA